LAYRIPGAGQRPFNGVEEGLIINGLVKIADGSDPPGRLAVLPRVMSGNENNRDRLSDSGEMRR
jgi:hypothetical protein